MALLRPFPCSVRVAPPCAATDRDAGSAVRPRRPPSSSIGPLASHWPRLSESTRNSHTVSIGPGSRRSKRTSAGRGDAAIVVRCRSFAAPLLRLAGVTQQGGLEGVEAAGPEALVVGDPAVGFGERAGLDATGWCAPLDGAAAEALPPPAPSRAWRRRRRTCRRARPVRPPCARRSRAGAAWRGGWDRPGRGRRDRGHRLLFNHVVEYRRCRERSFNHLVELSLECRNRPIPAGNRAFSTRRFSLGGNCRKERAMNRRHDLLAVALGGRARDTRRCAPRPNRATRWCAPNRPASTTASGRTPAAFNVCVDRAARAFDRGEPRVASHTDRYARHSVRTP